MDEIYIKNWGFRRGSLLDICRRAAVFGALALASVAPRVAAQEAATFASAFSIPVFEQVDANGVDLVSGVWRVATPAISVGEGVDKFERGLQWVGQAWTHIGQPSLWRKDNKYIVMYKGGSHEFNGFGSGFSKRAPVDGTSLSCDTLSAGNGITYCRFYSRDGDYVVFSGFYSALSNFGQNMGLSSLQFGNVGVQQVLSSEVIFGSPTIRREANNQYMPGSSYVRKWGEQVIFYGTPLWDFNYNTQNKTISIGGGNSSLYRSMLVTTPNNDSSDDHYLMPRNVIQTMTDNFGNVWSYQINNNRDLVSVNQPGGNAATVATYNGDHKVLTISTPVGVWNYSYNTSLGDFGSTTVTNPQGEATYVKYHREDGYVTEVRDALNRTTYYTWNVSTRRLERVTYPEGNYDAFEYDGRGNVTKKTRVAKDGITALEWQAEYPASCPTGGNCNQPSYVIDPKHSRTDFEYTGNSPGPTKVIYPAADVESPRKIETSEYANGRLVRATTCNTQSECAGTADEVIKEFSYSARPYAPPANSVTAPHASGSMLVLVSEKVTSDGQSLLTCHQYDANGHRVMTTPPNANRTSCPTEIGGGGTATENPPSAGYARSQPTFPGP